MNHKTRTAILASAVLGVVAGGLTLAVMPVQAAPAVAKVVCGDWQARGATGAYPAVTFGGPPAGTEIITKHTAKLVKPASGVQPGVEFAAKNLSITTTAVTGITVSYVPSADASAVSGAIRLFGYEVQNADTLMDAPDFQDVATSETGGTLTLTIPAGKTIGTLGLVYDASNSSAGSVTFSGMMAGNRQVWFTPCTLPPPSLPASASASVSASASASASPSSSVSSSASATSSSSVPVSATPSVSVPASVTPSAEPVRCQQYLTQADAQEAYEADPIGLAALDPDQDGNACDFAPGQAGGSGDLPLTGPSLGLIIGGSLLLIGTGLGMLYLVRRRKVTSMA
jgi:hypothetical protein